MEQSEESKFDGLAVARALWLWGSLVWIAPPYIGFGGWGQWLFNIIGALFIAVAFCGAGLELGKLWKNEAFEYWGVGLVFLVPAGLLHGAVWWADLSSPWPAIAKSLALFLDAFGGTFVLMGVPYLFGRFSGADTQPTELSSEEKQAVGQRRKEVAASTGLLLLTAVTAIVKTMFGI